MADSMAHRNMVIGQVIMLHPQAREVIEKYFGTGCLTCPGLDQETISFGASMHGVDPEVVVQEINRLSRP